MILIEFLFVSRDVKNLATIGAFSSSVSETGVFKGQVLKPAP